MLRRPTFVENPPFCRRTAKSDEWPSGRHSGFFTSSSMILKKSSSVGCFLGFGGALKCSGTTSSNSASSAESRSMTVGARFGPLGLGLIGVEPGKVHERVPLPLDHDLFVQIFVRAQERLGAGRLVVDREQVPGDSELFVGHDALLAREQRAVDGRSVGASQVADHPDSIHEPELAVFARDVLEIETDVGPGPPADMISALVRGIGSPPPTGYMTPRTSDWGRMALPSSL